MVLRSSISVLLHSSKVQVSSGGGGGGSGPEFFKGGI